MKRLTKITTHSALVALLCGASACGSSSDSTGNETLNGIGDGETGVEEARSNGGAADDGASSESATSLSPSAGSAGGATAGETGGASGADGTATGGGALGGFDSAGEGLAPPVSGEPSSGDIVDMDAASNPPFQAGSLTAGAWDDNLNFERFLAYRKEQHQNQTPGLLSFTADDHRAAQEASEAARHARERLDIALVIDTTGSMADELSYLQAELISISERVEAAYPDAEQRWALVFYRDHGDAYETRYFDFRDDVDEARQLLSEQSADGGGDTPEAAHAALEVTTQLAWRMGEKVSRLAFWVADAPHHAQHADALKSAIEAAQDLDIHLYPVASSGVDELTELSMRSAAQLTFGRYLFLTDDSGFGGAHKEPSIPCYFVTRLDQAMLRMIDVELSGDYREPAEEDILRTGGDPENGACTTESGDELEVF